MLQLSEAEIIQIASLLVEVMYKGRAKEINS